MIETQKDYEKALARAEELMDAGPGTPEEKELIELAARIENYENKYWLELSESSFAFWNNEADAVYDKV